MFISEILDKDGLDEDMELKMNHVDLKKKKVSGKGMRKDTKLKLITM